MNKIKDKIMDCKNWKEINELNNTLANKPECENIRKFDVLKNYLHANE